MKEFLQQFISACKKLISSVGNIVYGHRQILLKAGFWILVSFIIYYPHIVYLKLRITINNCCAPLPLGGFLQHDTTRDWRDKFYFKNGILRCDSALQGSYAITFYDLLRVQQDSVRKRDFPSAKFRDSLRTHNIPFDNSFYVPLSPWSEPLSICKISEVKEVFFNYLENIEIGNARETSLTNCYFSSKKIKISECSFDSLYFSGIGKDISLSYSKFNNSVLNLNATNTSIQNCGFRDSSLNIIGVQSTISDCNFINTKLKISVDSTTIEKSDLGESTAFISVGNYCKLSSVNGNGKIELIKNEIDGQTKELINLNSGKSSEIEDYDTVLRVKVVLSDINFTRLKFSPKSIFFIVDTTNQTYASQCILYKQIIEYYKEDNDERKLYDVQFKKLINKHDGRWFIDFLEENFNQYGYKPNRIWVFAGTIFLFFLIINNLLYPYILKNGYEIKKIEDSYKTYDNFIYQFFFDLGHSILYSVLVFWIFRIDLEKLRASNLWLTVLIILEHVIALVLLAFIASTILNNPIVF